MSQLFGADLRQELEEFIQELTGEAHAGEPFHVRANHVVREGVDILGKFYHAIDAHDQAEDIAQFAQELADMAGVVVKALFVNKPAAGRAAQFMIPYVAEYILKELAAYGGDLQEFVEEKLLPVLAELEETLEYTREVLLTHE